jgi:serine/threonine-protein kinase
LRRPTAIKLLPIDKVGEQTIARFEREVQQTSRLEHPNSVYIYDYGRSADGVFYYAMEYLDGLNLQQLVDRYGPIRNSRVRHLLLQAANALAEAHSMGLIHRDIKPANIMVCERGGIPDVVKVLDFGLVKELEEGKGDAGVTNAESIIGTPHYLAPEAIKSPEAISPATDIYALGAVGYFLLTGEEPFRADSVVEVCAKHLTEEPTPPSEKAEEVDPALEQLILRCLAKDPADRPRDGQALADALEALDLHHWSARDARAWWKDYQAQPSPEYQEEAPHELFSIDVGRRL